MERRPPEVAFALPEYLRIHLQDGAFRNGLVSESIVSDNEDLDGDMLFRSGLIMGQGNVT